MAGLAQRGDCTEGVSAVNHEGLRVDVGSRVSMTPKRRETHHEEECHEDAEAAYSHEDYADRLKLNATCRRGRESKRQDRASSDEDQTNSESGHEDFLQR